MSAPFSGVIDIAVFGFDAKKGVASEDDVWSALMLLQGEIRPEGAIARTLYPSETTKPTKDECHAAVARVLNESAAELYGRDNGSQLAFVLNTLARCFSPTAPKNTGTTFLGGYERLAEIRSRGKGYETDEARDESVAGLVWGLFKGMGERLPEKQREQRAISEAAAILKKSPKAVREACKRATGRIAEDARKRGEKTCPECGGGDKKDVEQCPACKGKGFVPLDVT
jgi:hypothetical protein